MIKLLITGFHLVLLSWLSFKGEESPKVQQLIPVQLDMNESTVVTVSIQKNQLSGFAKLEIDIPDGYAVSAMETKGASFTFAKGKMRFVWMNLPTADKYNVSYRITRREFTGDLQSVKGVFSYIQDNKRNDVNIVTNTTFEKQQDNFDDSYGLTTLISAQDNPSCERKITKLDEGYVVELLVHLNGLKGFLKLQEWVNEGCSLSKSQNAAAAVSIDGPKIKFVWFEVPDSPTMVVKYKVNCPQLPEGGLQVEGKMSFVFENNPREIPVTMMESNPVETKSNVDSVVAASDKNKEVVEEKELVQVPVTENKVVEVPEKTQVQETKAVPTSSSGDQLQAEGSSSKTVPMPSSAMGSVSYKVQILANHRKVSAEEWRTKFGFEDNYDVENHQGWMKWTHGSYSEYKQAKEYRNAVSLKCPALPGPFVTAYQDGKRITVQEALMITQQPWVQ